MHRQYGSQVRDSFIVFLNHMVLRLSPTNIPKSNSEESSLHRRYSTQARDSFNVFLKSRDQLPQKKDSSFQTIERTRRYPRAILRLVSTHQPCFGGGGGRGYVRPTEIPSAKICPTCHFQKGGGLL